MKVNPAVSVVMSVYNGERYLRQAVDSILAQTFTDFEFIIIDDGSTDSTREILESYQDGRINLVHQENMGVTRALNNGIALARGKYIARQDADDVSKMERLEKQVTYMETHPSVGLLGTRFEFIDQFGQVTGLGTLPTDNAVLLERMKVINQFSHGSVIIRKEALDRVGVFRDFFKYAQDYDLWLRIAEQYEIVNLPEHLFCYRELEQAISSSKILTQSLYAGIAAEMAQQRKETGSDALQNGVVPALPSVQRLSTELHEKLVDFYCQNPHELVQGLKMDTDGNKDLEYLLERICSDKRQLQAELNKRTEIIYKVDERVRHSLAENNSELIGELRNHLCSDFRQIQEAADKRYVQELQQIQAEQEKELKEKAAELTDLDAQLTQLGEELVCAGQLRVELENCLDQRSFDLVKRDDRIKQIRNEIVAAREREAEMERRLEEKSAALSDRDERIRQIEQEVALEGQRLEEHLRRTDELIRQKDDAHRKQEIDLRTKTDDLKALETELATIRQETEQERENIKLQILEMEERIGQRDQRIDDLLKSLSWRVTGPIRATYDLLKGRK